MRDAYINFFNKFNIDTDELIQFGLYEDTIYPDPDKIYENWTKLIEDISLNKKAYIRGYGRDAKGTGLYIEFYRLILGNSNIKKDPTNNNNPTRILQEITGYSKTIKKNNQKLIKIINYQVSHIFGKTKNPFMFSAPWNIVWKSKILDPFTGHEATGAYPEKYKNNFQNLARNKYQLYISEYNNIVQTYFNDKKVKKTLDEMNDYLLKNNIDKRVFDNFKKDLINEISKI
jgi:hypothetical protein